MSSDSEAIRRSLLEKWHENLSQHGNLFSSNSISGSTPPSVFVGSYGYPKVFVGPMVPPVHGDTSVLDLPEQWAGRTLDEIVNFRLSLVRGVQKVAIQDTGSRYVEGLQEVAMSSRPTDSDLLFSRLRQSVHLDGQSAPFGPVGEIRGARFSDSPSIRQVEKAFYDRDLGSQDAVLELYRSGIDVSRIQRCFSMGMLGRRRKLVPTKWSITATDDIISKSLVSDVLEYPVADSYNVFSYEHLGNVFSVVLFPHRWVYEMIEAWYSGGALGFGSDSEDARGMRHPPSIAGAYFAAKLGVAEYLHRKGVQSGVLVLREIRPEYSMPVGVWQVREGIRRAMESAPQVAWSLEGALDAAVRPMGISKAEWLSKGNIIRLARQKAMSDYF